jgi:hypothetical protein
VTDPRGRPAELSARAMRAFTAKNRSADADMPRR